jgi:hypothetical protein
MMVSFLCKVAGDTDWHPVTSEPQDSPENLLSWIEGFMGTNNPVTIKRLRMWK